MAMMESDRQDLSPLNPRTATDRWERMVTNIMERSALELRRRRVAPQDVSIFDGLLAWTRPALATAAALALMSLIALSQLRTQPVSAQSAYFRSANLPPAVTVMLEEGEAPSVLDLLVMSGEN